MEEFLENRNKKYYRKKEYFFKKPLIYSKAKKIPKYFVNIVLYIIILLFISLLLTLLISILFIKEPEFSEFKTIAFFSIQGSPIIVMLFVFHFYTYSVHYNEALNSFGEFQSIDEFKDWEKQKNKSFNIMIKISKKLRYRIICFFLIRKYDFIKEAKNNLLLFNHEQTKIIEELYEKKTRRKNKYNRQLNPE